MVGDTDTGNAYVGIYLNHGEADGLDLTGRIGKIPLHAGVTQSDSDICDFYVFHINDLLQSNYFTRLGMNVTMPGNHVISINTI